VSRIERLYSPPEIGAPGKRAARTRRRDLLLAGMFVLAMAAMALGAAALLIPGLFGGVYRLHAFFEDARGLDPGIQVMQDGYRIGMVESVEPVFPHRYAEVNPCPQRRGESDERPANLPCFRATLRVLDDWPIPEQSVAQLGSAGLLQGEAVKIYPGASQRLLGDGARISAKRREPDLAVQLSQLTNSLQSLVDETVGPALASLQKQIRTIEDLMGTGEDNAANRDRLAGAFTSLQRLASNIERAIDPEQLADILSSVQQVSVNLTEVSRGLAGKTAGIERAVDEYGSLAADMRRLLHENSPSIERSLGDTQYLLQELAAALTPILTNIEDATRNLSALSRDLRNNPAVIIQGREVETETPWFK
jgi:phospholipid/cholesterol/gamma-HCH transport system substrate-binding protein